MLSIFVYFLFGILYYSDEERFCLRLLLLSVRGPISFEDLKTVNGILHPSFKAAAIARNLLADDTAWSNTLAEAGAFKMPSQLRHLFVTVCVFGCPQNALKLFEENIHNLSEDFLHRNLPEGIARNLALHEIQLLLQNHGKQLHNYGLPACDLSIINQHLTSNCCKLFIWNSFK